MEGRFAFVTSSWYGESDEGLQVINISDPQSPYVDGHFDTPGLARGVGVLGDLVYVADESGFLVLRVAGM